MLLRDELPADEQEVVEDGDVTSVVKDAEPIRKKRYLP